MGAQLDACAFPPDVGAAVGGDAEIVVMLAGEITLSPARLDSRLCQDNRRIDPECFPRLSGEGRREEKNSLCFIFLVER